MQVKKIHKRYNLQFQQYQVISCHNKANKPKKTKVLLVKSRLLLISVLLLFCYHFGVFRQKRMKFFNKGSVQSGHQLAISIRRKSRNQFKLLFRHQNKYKMRYQGEHSKAHSHTVSLAHAPINKKTPIVQHGLSAACLVYFSKCKRPS